MKVSFDFDDCLDNLVVQEYATELIKRGVDVWICTARTPSLGGVDNIDYGWNRDVFRMCKDLGIPDDHVIMTDCGLKSFYLNNKDFIWHLDDMMYNITDIREESDCWGVLYSPFDMKWKEVCETKLEQWQEEQK